VPDATPESWKPIAGYEGFYEVSDLGRVRNVRTSRIIAQCLRGYSGITGRGVGYLTVKLCRDGIVKRYKVHRLVGEAFIGPLPPGMQTRHGPGRTLDNRLVNLSYGTPRENIHDQIRDGVDTRGGANAQAKLTNKAVAAIRVRYAAGELQDALAREFGVTQTTISRVIRGASWTVIRGTP
jgi:hypothetical protein